MFSGCSLSTEYWGNSQETNISEQKKSRGKASVQKKARGKASAQKKVEPKREAFFEKKRKNSTQKQNVQKRKETPTVKKATEKDVLDFFDL